MKDIEEGKKKLKLIISILCNNDHMAIVRFASWLGWDIDISEDFNGYVKEIKFNIPEK